MNTDFRNNHIRNGSKEILTYIFSTINSAVDFGSNLVYWDGKRFNEGVENFVPIFFLRNFLELCDAISILISESSIAPCKPILRSLLENSLGLQYLLIEKQSQKCLSYLVWNSVQNIKRAEKFNKKTIPGKQLLNEIKKDRFINDDIDEIVNLDNSEIIMTSKSILNNSKFKETYQEYNRVHSNVKKNPNWYTLFNGPMSIEQLAKHLELHSLYEIIFRELSKNTHANNLTNGNYIKKDNGNFDIAQIRNPEGLIQQSNICLNLISMTYMSFYKSRLPDKRIEMLNWYKSFRIDIRNIANINIEIE